MLQAIATHIEQTNTLAASIAQPASNQSSTFHQINQVIADLDRVTQQNAAMAEEGRGVADKLSSETENVAQLVSRLRVRGARTEDRSNTKVARLLLANDR